MDHHYGVWRISMTISTISDAVTDIPRERLEEAVEALALAFEDYPLMRHFFEEREGEYPRLLRQFMRFSCEVRLHLGMPLLGNVSGGRIAGVAGLTTPEVGSWPSELARMHEALRETIGPLAAERLDEYSQLAEQYEPKDSHYYLGILGVRPEEQGKGHAKALLDRLHELSQAHPNSTGVYLDTEHPENVQLYEHFGYRVVGHARLGAVGVWCMWRPNESR